VLQASLAIGNVEPSISRRILMIARSLLVVGLFAIPALAVDDKEKDKEKPLGPVEARKQVGKEITVEMEVKTAKNALEKRGEIYLDSEENFRDEKNFAVVITRKGAESLRATGIDDPVEHFKGKTIQAKGTVSEVDKIPRIEIDDAKQIQIPKKK
jgi:DNA/RNA endonuclease YhcR with UshA esterase domain